MDLQTTLERCQELTMLGRSKHPEAKVLSIEVAVNIGAFSPFRILLIVNQEYEELKFNSYTCESPEAVVAKLDELETLFLETPDWAERQKTIAIQKLGRALDVCKDAGLDVTPLSELLGTLLLPAAA